MVILYGWWWSIWYLVGGIPTPLKNDGVRQLGWHDIPNIWEVIQNSMVPNHQPVILSIYIYTSISKQIKIGHPNLWQFHGRIHGDPSDFGAGYPTISWWWSPIYSMQKSYIIKYISSISSGKIIHQATSLSYPHISGVYPINIHKW